jgi:hypothetical protein
MSARGDDPLRIMQRAGHEDFETTKIYLREAENLAKAFGSVFPVLPDRLLRIAPNRPGAIAVSLSSEIQGLFSGADENRPLLHGVQLFAGCSAGVAMNGTRAQRLRLKQSWS